MFSSGCGGDEIVIPATTTSTSVGFIMIRFLIEDFSFVVIIYVGWVVDERRELGMAIVAVTIRSWRRAAVTLEVVVTVAIVIVTIIMSAGSITVVVMIAMNTGSKLSE